MDMLTVPTPVHLCFGRVHQYTSLEPTGHQIQHVRWIENLLQETLKVLSSIEVWWYRTVISQCCCSHTFGSEDSRATAQWYGARYTSNLQYTSYAVLAYRTSNMAQSYIIQRGISLAMNSPLISRFSAPSTDQANTTRSQPHTLPQAIQEHKQHVCRYYHCRRRPLAAPLANGSRLHACKPAVALCDRIPPRHQRLRETAFAFAVAGSPRLCPGIHSEPRLSPIATRAGLDEEMEMEAPDFAFSEYQSGTFTFRA